MWFGMVLVLSPARLLAKRLAYRPICYELCGVSKRVEYGGADHFFVTHGVVPRCRRRSIGGGCADRAQDTAGVTSPPKPITQPCPTRHVR
jgi:hypothetical protein